jgi:hypothetical protein
MNDVFMVLTITLPAPSFGVAHTHPAPGFGLPFVSMKTNTISPDSSCSVNGTIGFERSAIVLTMKQKLPRLPAKSCNDPGTTFQSGRV